MTFVSFEDVTMGDEFLSENGNGRPVMFKKELHTNMKSWDEGEDSNCIEVKSGIRWNFPEDEEVIVQKEVV
mgnify:CR=1 FL=1|jgi:hypothetical protein